MFEVIRSNGLKRCCSAIIICVFTQYCFSSVLKAFWEQCFHTQFKSVRRLAVWQPLGSTKVCPFPLGPASHGADIVHPADESELIRRMVLRRHWIISWKAIQSLNSYITWPGSTFQGFLNNAIVCCSTKGPSCLCHSSREHAYLWWELSNPRSAHSVPII